MKLIFLFGILANDFPENEIPTTIIRSKAECPNLDAYNSISTNEIIMNKLIQIWTHIRQGSSKKQRRKFESLPSSSRNESSIKQDKTKYQDDNIYDDVGDSSNIDSFKVWLLLF